MNASKLVQGTTEAPAERSGHPGTEDDETVSPDDRGPTRERLRHAIYGVAEGNDRGRVKRRRIKDSLDRMFDKNVLSGSEYAALQKYKLHWIRAGKEAAITSVDLNSVFSSNPSQRAGMAMGEMHCHHDKQWRAGRAAIGHRASIVVDNVICAELTLEIAGYAVGWRSKPQAIAAATEMLRDAGYRLSKLWGIG
jgi:hypothetical protein